MSLMEKLMSARMAIVTLALASLFAFCGCAGAYVAGDAGPHHQDNFEASGPQR